MDEAPFWIHVLRTLLTQREAERQTAALLDIPLDPAREERPTELLATYEDFEIEAAADLFDASTDLLVRQALRDELHRRGRSDGDEAPCPREPGVALRRVQIGDVL